MSIQVDRNRVNFNELEVENDALGLGLLEPIVDFPIYNAATYKTVPIDVDGKANKEKLVDVAEAGIKSVPYYRTQAKNNPTYKSNVVGAPDVNYAREGTVDALLKANEILNKLGLELVVLDAHRSPATQRKLFKAFEEQFFEAKGCGLCAVTDKNRAQILNKRKYLAEDAKIFALDYCSSADGFDPKNPKTWPMHSTGGAVDVVLLEKKTGKVVDMGEGYFDNPKDITHTHHYEKKGELSDKEKGFLKARRVLYNAMTKVGFVNYGYECFHYSLGDQYWALLKGKTASYGYKMAPRDVGLSRVVGGLLNVKNV